MKCGFCGTEFDLLSAEEACRACPIVVGCRLVRCPNCGYEMPPEAKLVSKLRELRKKQLFSAPLLPSNGNKPSERDSTLASLDKLLPGEFGQIVRVSMKDAKILKKLMAMNLLPGVMISLISRSPTYVLQSGHSQFALDEEIAGRIYVRINGCN